MAGHKHLVECHCVLPLYKDQRPVVYHKFSVYSKIDTAGKVIPKYVNCNNCGITHYVYEICRSDIKVGKEDIGSVRTIKDISISLPERLVSILEEYNVLIDVYEELEDCLEEDSYPANIIIKREIIDDDHQIKVLNVKSKDSFKILSETLSTVFVKH